jgi:phenylpropionate dioxygenase-like ring-hydroxylating dioxygenase large terminal subunit
VIRVAPGAYVQAQRAMDPAVYVDPTVFEAEVGSLLSRTWQYAGHATQLDSTGDFITHEVGGESLFTVRDQDGRVRTFYNVCMHRGHQLLQGSGRRRQIVCPYHAWSYRLDGRLRMAPHAEGRDGFDAAEICLTEVRTEEFCGFYFVNLDPDAPGMDELFPGIRSAIVEFLPTIGDMAPIERREFVAECNWKVAVENYNECYHCKTAHKSFSKGVVLPASYTIRPIGRCLNHSAETSPQQYYEIDHEASPNAARYSSFFLWPLFSLQVYPGPIVNTFVWRPRSVNRTPFFREWFTPGGTDSPVVRQVADEDARTTVAEDLDLVRSVQRGVASRGYRPGPLIIDPGMGLNSEHSVAALKAWYLEEMERGPSPSK